MLSDVLVDALDQAREYQENYPDMYKTDEVETVLTYMEILSSYFWTPPPAYEETGIDLPDELKKALPSVAARNRAVKAWNDVYVKMNKAREVKYGPVAERRAQRYAAVTSAGSAMFGTASELRDRGRHFGRFLKVFTEEEYGKYFYPLAHKLGVVKALDAMGPGLKFKQLPDFELIPQLQAVNE